MKITWLVTATILVAASVVHADPPGLVPALEPPTPSTSLVDSYRMQTLAIDAAAVAVFAAGASRNTDAVGKVAVAAYVFGAPTLHLFHDRPGRALGSLALRVGLPVAAAMIGSRLLADGQDGDGDIAGAILGAGVGALAASLIDIGYLSKGDAPPHVTPAVAPTNGGMTFGLAGSF